MILMQNKKSIIINSVIIGVIMGGYVVVTYSTTATAPRMMSFEGPGMQSRLLPLNAEAGNSSDSANHGITFDKFRGHHVLITFWASWCKACENEEANIEKLATKYSGGSVDVVGIATSDTRDAIAKSGKLQAMHYPQYLDESGGLAQALKIETLPQTILINSDGQILKRLNTAVDARLTQELDQQMATLRGSQNDFGTVPSFQLMSSLDRPIGTRDLAGKVWVADFIYTSCGGQCPVLTSKMRTIQEEFKGNDQVKLISISVDPKNDTPPVLKSYQAKYGADSGQWYFLTGKMDSIKALLIDGFKLGTTDNPEIHTTQFVLVDRLGKIRGYYDADSAQAIADLKTNIHRLLNY